MRGADMIQRVDLAMATVAMLRAKQAELAEVTQHEVPLQLAHGTELAVH